MHGIFFTCIAVPERPDQIVNDDDGFYYNKQKKNNNNILGFDVTSEKSKIKNFKFLPSLGKSHF